MTQALPWLSGATQYLQATPALTEQVSPSPAPARGDMRARVAGSFMELGREYPFFVMSDRFLLRRPS